MRLNVPPTLKHSSLMDSNLLSPASSAVNKNPKSPRFIQNDASKVSNKFSQFGDQASNNGASSQSIRQSNKQLLSPYHQNKNYGNGMIDDRLKNSTRQLLKNMPLFNQFQTQSCMSDVKISQIPKKEADYYQQEFQDDQVIRNLSPKLKRKSSSNDGTNFTRQTSPKMGFSGVKRMASMDTINQQQNSNSNNSNSLKGSKKFQTNSILNSLRKTPIGSQSKFTANLQVIQEVNKQKNGVTQSQYQNTQILDSSRIQNQLEELKNNNTIQISQIQSEEQVSGQNSIQSLKTVNLAKKISKQEKKNKNKNSKTENQLKVHPDNKIQLKLQQIQRSLKLEDNDSSYQDMSRTQTQLLPSMRLQSKGPTKKLSSKNQQLIKKSTEQQKNLYQAKKEDKNYGSQNNIFSQINDRFKKMKQIKNGGPINSTQISTYNSSNNPSYFQQNLNIPTSNLKKYVDKSIQTDIQIQPTYNKISQNIDIQSIRSQYCQQIQLLQRQNTKFRKQIKSNQQLIQQQQFMKNKYEQENKFLNQKIKRLERILEKNQKELQEWRQIAKQGGGNQIQSKVNQNIKTPVKNSQQWLQKEKVYQEKINRLQTQIHRLNQSFHELGNGNNVDHRKRQIDKIKQYEYLTKLCKYEQNLTKNMLLIKKQQQKIMKQWKLIQQFHAKQRQDYKRNQSYQNKQSQWSLRQNYKSLDKYKDRQQVYERDYDIVSIGQKIKSMRSQLARDNR